MKNPQIPPPSFKGYSHQNNNDAQTREQAEISRLKLHTIRMEGHIKALQTLKKRLTNDTSN